MKDGDEEFLADVADNHEVGTTVITPHYPMTIESLSTASSRYILHNG